MSQYDERVAVLESRVCALKEELDDISRKQDAILAELTRYRGFIGGIAFVASGAFMAWQFVGEWVKRNL